MRFEALGVAFDVPRSLVFFAATARELLLPLALAPREPLALFDTLRAGLTAVARPELFARFAVFFFAREAGVLGVRRRVDLPAAMFLKASVILVGGRCSERPEGGALYRIRGSDVHRGGGSAFHNLQAF